MSQRKARSTIGLYAPNLLGYTWTTMAWTIGCDAVRRSQSPKPCLSSDRGLKLTLVKMKSLVIAGHHPAVNMSLLLAHTARQTNRVNPERGPLIRECRVLDSQGGLSRNKVAVGESAAGSPPSLINIRLFLRVALLVLKSIVAHKKLGYLGYPSGRARRSVW